MRKAALHNLGCINAYETEAMQQLLEDAGFMKSCLLKMGPMYIINTCSVTNVADKNQGRCFTAKKMNPDSVVVAVGCYVQAAKEDLEKDMAVDLIIGNNKKKDLVGLLERYFADRDDREEVIDIAATGEYEELHIRKIADHTRAFLKVQDGCNQFLQLLHHPIYPWPGEKPGDRGCGEGGGRPLAAAGYKEIVLTGIHLSSLRRRFSRGKEGKSSSLITRLDKNPGN